jgi:hypothetical protein
VKNGHITSAFVGSDESFAPAESPPAPISNQRVAVPTEHPDQRTPVRSWREEEPHDFCRGVIVCYLQDLDWR